MINAALITGAAGGLGFEFARLLAKDGYNLLLIDIDEKALNRVRDELEKAYGISVKTMLVDLTNPDAVGIIEDFTANDEIEILINNAGHGLWGRFLDNDIEKEQSMISLHVDVPTRLSKIILRRMLERKSGRVMNVSSLAAFNPGPMMAVYYASKAYLLSFGRAVANELKGSGVSMTTFCPGLIRTGFAESVAYKSGVPKMKEGYLSDKADRIALIGYKAMMKRRAVSVPLLKNKIMVFGSWLIPSGLLVRLLRRAQDNIHNND